MEITARVGRQVLLLSLLILIPPMILFPERLGTWLVKASLVNVVYELVYYGIVIFIINRRPSPLQMAQAAGICLIYRLLLGAVFGFLIAAMYSMNLAVSLTLGMSSYLPVILLQIVATPFVLKPIIGKLLPTAEDRPSLQRLSPTAVSDQGPTSVPVPVDKGSPGASPAASHEHEVCAAADFHPDISPTPIPADANGFDRATRYIGEDASVLLAAVVDHEGLLLGHFERGAIEPEDWAPFCLLFTDTNHQLLNRFGLSAPEKIDLLLRERKIVVAREESFSLMVIAQRRSDDFLRIRINRGLEMIKKYMAERYGRELLMNVERVYVSST